MAVQKHNLSHYLFVIFYSLIKEITFSILWLLLIVLGYLIFKSQVNPVGVVVGIPLILAGGGLIINNLASLFQAIFSSVYNRGVCPFCRPKD